MLLQITPAIPDAPTGPRLERLDADETRALLAGMPHLMGVLDQLEGRRGLSSDASVPADKLMVAAYDDSPYTRLRGA